MSMVHQDGTTFDGGSRADPPTQPLVNSLAELAEEVEKRDAKWIAASALYLQGWTIPQIARAFGCHKGNVSRRMRTALRRACATRAADFDAGAIDRLFGDLRKR